MLSTLSSTRGRESRNHRPGAFVPRLLHQLRPANLSPVLHLLCCKFRTATKRSTMRLYSPLTAACNFGPGSRLIRNARPALWEIRRCFGTHGNGCFGTRSCYFGIRVHGSFGTGMHHRFGTWVRRSPRMLRDIGVF